MRLRALHLSNVRKFAGKRASITGIGDGITVVSEANEFGKSTFFDALHALFFEKYSSSAKPIKSLQPYAKGAVEIAAEIETDAGLFRVEKSFLQRKTARILRLPSEDVIAVEDAAERWISEALGSDKNGPAGLLWVRQGVTGLDAETRDETAKQLETRRDLLSSVSGEIDAMTGGRRMDRVMRRVGDALKELVTATGKPTGAWRALATDITAMEAELARLDAQIVILSEALKGRKNAEEQLSQLDRAEAKTLRAEALANAETAFAQAKAHAGRVERAAQEHRLAEIDAQGRRGDLDRFLAALQSLEAAQAALQTARDALAEAEAQSTQRQASLTTLQATAAQTKAAVAAAHTGLETARQQTTARAARARAHDLNERLQQIEKVQKTRDEAQARVRASRATPEVMRAIEAAQNAVSASGAALSAQAVSVRIVYTGEGRVLRGGKPLSDAEPLVLTGTVDLALDGIGTMMVQVPETGAEAAAELARRQSALKEMLAQVGAASVDAARDLAALRAQALQDLESSDTILKTLAPNGADPLRAEKAAADLAAEGAHDDTLSPQAELDATLARAQAEDAVAQAAATQAETTHRAAREALILAQASAQNLQQALDKAQAEAGAPEARDAKRAALIRADAQAVETVETTSQAVAVLRAQAPDLATAQAELTRAQAAVTAAEAQIQTLRVRIAALSAEIHALSETGIEETRDTLAGQLMTARTQEARIAQKAAALTRLQGALEAERIAARDTYFGPVQKELAPLLAILYDEAGLQFDTDNLLPMGLTRAQTEERFDSLSGGTQEQIAILTRLAFARLFKGQGRHMPIVLDDALVYSDDGRIVKMFTALTRVAEDQQVLVFTCRTMAFLSLGGTRPEVMIHDV